MATLTISSGVHVGARGAGAITQAWFAASPTTQFTTFSLTSAGADVRLRQGPQAIAGHASLTDAPIAFEFSRLTRDVLTDSLATIAVKRLMNGGPKVTLSDDRAAVAVSGYLAKFAWSEPRTSGAATQSFEVWGVARVATAEVRALQQAMTLIVHPCEFFWLYGTETVFASPTAYAALSAGA